jgi:hypothetical protein
MLKPKTIFISPILLSVLFLLLLSSLPAYATTISDDCNNNTTLSVYTGSKPLSGIGYFDMLAPVSSTRSMYFTESCTPQNFVYECDFTPIVMPSGSESFGIGGFYGINSWIFVRAWGDGYWHMDVGADNNTVPCEMTVGNTYRLKLVREIIDTSYYYYFYVDDVLTVTANTSTAKFTTADSHPGFNVATGDSTRCQFRIDNVYYDDAGTPEYYNATGLIVMAEDPVTLFTNATGELTIDDPTYRYDEIDWYNNGNQIRQFKLSGSQWQQWNGTAWANCANSSVFTVSQYQDWVGTCNFYAWIKYHGNVVIGVNKNFQVIQNATHTTYYLRVVDSTGADLSSFNGHFFESEDPTKDYTFTWSGYGAVLDLNRHYQGVVSADGFINSSIAFETTYNNSSSVTYRTVTITMVSSDVPTDPAQAYLDVKVYDSLTNEMVSDAVFTLTNTSGSKTYQIYGTVKRITIEKGVAYTWKAASSSYYSMTGTVNMTDGQAMLLVPLNPIPAPTATPQPSAGYYTGDDGNPTYTPYTDTQRQNQAMTMIDQLLNAGPSLMQLGILAVFMGLVMMLFPDGKKRRYR